jgi:hypothetical protein
MKSTANKSPWRDTFLSSDAIKNFRRVTLGIGTLLYSDGLINNRYLHNHWVSGLYPPSGILKTTEHNGSETGSLNVTRCVGDTYFFLLLVGWD